MVSSEPLAGRLFSFGNRSMEVSHQDALAPSMRYWVWSFYLQVQRESGTLVQVLSSRFELPSPSDAQKMKSTLLARCDQDLGGSLGSDVVWDLGLVSSAKRSSAALAHSNNTDLSSVPGVNSGERSYAACLLD